MTSASDRAMDFLEDWSSFHELLVKEGDLISFKPRFVYWGCDNCDNRYAESNCYGGGKYCSVQSNGNYLTGREVLDEDLRQKCLYDLQLKNGNEGMKLWFKYVERVHATCYDQVNEDCSRAAHKHFKLDYKDTWKCVTDTFSVKDNWGASHVRNDYLQ